jgi:hypothetical protein
MSAVGTFTAVQLSALGPDGSTFINIGSALSSNGIQQTGYLPAGQYRVTATASSVDVTVASVPI